MDPDPLHAQIGQLTLENDFLERALTKAVLSGPTLSRRHQIGTYAATAAAPQEMSERRSADHVRSLPDF